MTQQRRSYEAAAQTAGTTAIFNYCVYGSATGDIRLETEDLSVETTSLKMSDYVTLESVPLTLKSIRIRQPMIGGGMYPCFWAAAFDLMRSLSKEFKRDTSPLRLTEYKKYKKYDLPESGIFVLPDDDDPRELQVVASLDPVTAKFYIQQASGYVSHSGHPPEWKIRRAPAIVLQREEMSTPWANLFRAVAFHSRNMHLHTKEFAVPFDEALVKNPDLEWVCNGR